MLNIPTEPIGCIPRPVPLIEAIAANPEDPSLEGRYEAAVRRRSSSSRRPDPP